MYVSKACPFCGGTQIHKKGDGYECAYCLQPLEIKNGKLSDGYNKLASYNFVGAASFFRSVADSAGAEAYYGLFLATHKIEENEGKNGISPVVYSYCPRSFYEDPDFVALRAMCEGNRALCRKLDKIEEARGKTLAPQTEYDAVVFFDKQSAPRAAAFADTLAACGIRVLCAGDCAAADIATLRCVSAAYAFVSSVTEAQKFAESRVARRFLLLENARTAAGQTKKPMKLISAEPLPDILLAGLREIADVADLNEAAELRRLKSLCRASILPHAAAATMPAVAPKKVRAGTAETRVESAELDRLRRAVNAGAFSDALRQSERLQKTENDSRLYWYTFLAQAGARNEEDLVRRADDDTFSPQATQACDAALYKSGSKDEAQAYVDTLVRAALRLLDKKKAAAASRAVTLAFRYDDADPYADLLFDRLAAVKESIPFADWLTVFRKLTEQLRHMPEKYLARVIEGIDYALSAGEYARADDMAEGVLDAFPSSGALLLRKLLIENRVKSYEALLKTNYPRLGEPFVRYITALSPEEAARVLHATLDGLLAAPRDEFDTCAAAVYDVLALGEQLPALTKAQRFGSADYARVGEVALFGGAWNSAFDSFTVAIARDPRNYAARWGALKATLRCRTDRRAEGCDTPIDEVGTYFVDAYKDAYASHDTEFCRRIEEVRRRQRSAEKKEGHVFRKEDFDFSGDTLCRYHGDDECVYVGSGVRRIAASAFRGAAVKSVIVGSGVVAIGDHAFAYSSCEKIVLPPHVKVGDGAFLGCDALTEIVSADILPVSSKEEREMPVQWGSLYGSGANNMAATQDGGAARTTPWTIRYEKIAGTEGKPSGGLTVENDRVWVTYGHTLVCTDVRAALAGNAVPPKKYDLGAEACGTGVWHDGLLLQPTQADGGTLLYINRKGERDFSLTLGALPSRPLCLAGNTLLYVSGRQAFAIDVPRGKVTFVALPEKITSVPCARGDEFLAAGENSMYAITPSGEVREIYAIRGVRWGDRSGGRIYRGRVTASGGTAYWLETDGTTAHLCMYDGTAVGHASLPKSIVPFPQTQPVAANGKLFIGTSSSVVAAPIVAPAADWRFSAVASVPAPYAEMAIVRGAPVFDTLSGEYERLRLRAVTNTYALFADTAKGGIYVARL